ncbi:threonylcarbamoyl-AMP synthase [Battus philenor]|uniref:threonylcarbamoyl-AMP synthase n=1 Tax=Battus philenor TaxID=42288 RepID=UPI0035D0A0E6
MVLLKNLGNVIRYLVRYKTVSTKMKKDKMAEVIKCTDKEAFVKAAQYLEDGEVIAVPTDTVYGLACSAHCPEAIKKLYAIKGRDSAKPVAICVTYIDDIRKWGEAEHLSDDLLHALLPGPVTVVLEETKHFSNPYLNPTTSKIGIRIPDYLFINKLTKIFNQPIALTSANFSSEPSTLSVKEFEHLYCHLGAVFDGGVLSEGLDQNRTGSTIVDLSNIGSYRIIRKGVSYEKIITILKSHDLNSIVE